jgi:hypothetical protein
MSDGRRRGEERAHTVSHQSRTDDANEPKQRKQSELIEYRDTKMQEFGQTVLQEQ